MHKRKRRARNVTAIRPRTTAGDDNVIDRERQNDRMLALILIWTLALGIVAMSVDYVWNMVPQDPVDVSETEVPRTKETP